MASERVKPYTSTQLPWNNIINCCRTIPMNQRNYSWGEDEIITFIDDIIEIFEEGKYIEKMGSIINLSYNGENQIYDGQQRVITTQLLLFCLHYFHSQTSFLHKIYSLITIDNEYDTPTDKQCEIRDEYNVKNIPKLYCVNPYDRKALALIIDKQYLPFTYYAKNNFLDYEDIQEHHDYICEECNVKANRKTNFFRHLTNKHQYDKNTTFNDSNIYTAFDTIYNKLLTLPNKDDAYIVKLYKFILNDIDIQFYDCTDPIYVSKIFDWENNRGKNVEILDIMKNPILVNIPDDKKYEVYTKWEDYKSTTHPVYKSNKIKYGERLFNIAIQIYSNEISRKPNKETLYKKIIDAENTYAEINKLFSVIDALIEIMEKIKNDKYGSLLLDSPNVSLPWEAYMWCYLPIFYKTSKIDTNLIELFTKWYFRNICVKTRTFNNIAYSNKFIEVSNKVLNDSTYDYYTVLKNQLINVMDDIINQDNFVKTYETLPFNITNAKYTLSFLEISKQPDIYKHPNPCDITVEHIYSQKNKNNLTVPKALNYIGNLTLLEGKNSKNGHKGNFSIKNKSYSKKVESYKGSCFSITKDLCKNFTDFTEDSIKQRTRTLLTLLNNKTIF